MSGTGGMRCSLVHQHVRRPPAAVLPSDCQVENMKRSLPDMTLAMTRYVACVKNGELLGFARVVYVHWLFSSSRAVAKRRAEVAAAAQAR